MLFCPHCQAEPQPDDRYCRQCGARLPDPPSNPATPAAASNAPLAMPPAAEPALAAGHGCASQEVAPAGEAVSSSLRSDLHPRFALAMGVIAAVIIILGGLVVLRTRSSLPGSRAPAPLQVAPVPGAPASAPAATSPSQPTATAPVTSAPLPASLPEEVVRAFPESRPPLPGPGRSERRPAPPPAESPPAGRHLVPAEPAGLAPLPPGGIQVTPTSPRPAAPESAPEADSPPAEPRSAPLQPGLSSGFISIEPASAVPPAAPEPATPPSGLGVQIAADREADFDAAVAHHRRGIAAQRAGDRATAVRELQQAAAIYRALARQGGAPGARAAEGLQACQRALAAMQPP